MMRKVAKFVTPIILAAGVHNLYITIAYGNNGMLISEAAELLGYVAFPFIAAYANEFGLLGETQ